MKKYVFLGDCIDDCYAFNFWGNIQGKHKPPIDFFNEDDHIEAIRVNHNQKVAVTLTGNIHSGRVPLRAYKYNGEKHNHRLIEFVDPTPYIKDLIDANFVEEVR